MFYFKFLNGLALFLEKKNSYKQGFLLNKLLKLDAMLKIFAKTIMYTNKI